jgi:hypothetical protein
MRLRSVFILGFSLVVFAVASTRADDPSETISIEGGAAGSLRISCEGPLSKPSTLKVERLDNDMTKITWDKDWATCRRFKILMRDGRPETIDLFGDVNWDIATEAKSNEISYSLSAQRVQIQLLKVRTQQMTIRASSVEP